MSDEYKIRTGSYVQLVSAAPYAATPARRPPFRLERAMRAIHLGTAYTRWDEEHAAWRISSDWVNGGPVILVYPHEVPFVTGERLRERLELAR